MNVIRAFIAISLSDEVHHSLERVLQEMKNRTPVGAVRWVPAKNIHLTIKFLGDVSVGSLELLTSMLQTEAARHQQFEFSVGGLGVFPSARHPRVLWIGVEAPPELSVINTASSLQWNGWDTRVRISLFPLILQ